MSGFQDIPGQEHIKDHFQKAISNKKISHAYILSGESGMGHKLLAEAFALTLLCESGRTVPCLTCHSCKQAQNALLKTIEEPPSYVIIILLTTNQNTFLPTILSRCIQLKLKPLKDSIIRDYLINKLSVPETKADIYAAFARGNMGRAVKIAQSEEFKHMYEELIHVLRNIRDMDISMLLGFIKKMKEDNLDLIECLDFMQIWYRDALMFKVTKDANLLIFKDEYSAINEMSQ